MTPSQQAPSLVERLNARVLPVMAGAGQYSYVVNSTPDTLCQEAAARITELEARAERAEAQCRVLLERVEGVLAIAQQRHERELAEDVFNDGFIALRHFTDAVREAIGSPATKRELIPVLAGELREAAARLGPLLRYGEDAVWRPASLAQDALANAKDALEGQERALALAGRTLMKLDLTVHDLRVTVDRYERALTRLRDCDWTISLPDRMDAVREIARQALSLSGGGGREEKGSLPESPSADAGPYPRSHDDQHSDGGRA